eukprot:gnl/Hemi2/188_TR60_c0_g1_i1.p1 gnl/Hemi2/188_TR60_c0_g1~~gnl/Hemi2/188_TR60_c0_g1_i1.p1  ORF type:complete len:505 (+),score=159.57 gnl/Hemi2/188_TR60_c0_g1_i1:30-1517(+)
MWSGLGRLGRQLVLIALCVAAAGLGAAGFARSVDSGGGQDDVAPRSALHGYPPAVILDGQFTPSPLLQHSDMILQVLWKQRLRKKPHKYTLCLVIIAKNEEVLLERCLPEWAKVVDCWVIGLDGENTDKSEEVIRKHLGHLPGVVVSTGNFTGFGPTWNVPMDKVKELFKEADFVVLSESDWKPRPETFKWNELDRQIPSYTFTINEKNSQTQKQNNYIYLNKPDVYMLYRAHENLMVPMLPRGQKEYSRLLSFQVDETTGGAMEKLGKSGKYPNRHIREIELLKWDLAEFPDDPRIVYYLGVSHLMGWEASPEAMAAKKEYMIDQAIFYLTRRATVLRHSPAADAEFTWAAANVLAHMQLNLRNQQAEAFKWYDVCIELDPARADPWFYKARNLYDKGQTAAAWEQITKAIVIPYPSRRFANNYFLYQCEIPLMYAKVLSAMASAGLKHGTTLQNGWAKLALARSTCGTLYPWHPTTIKDLTDWYQRQDSSLRL